MRITNWRTGFLAAVGLTSTAAIAAAVGAPAYAQEAQRQFDIPAQPLASALIEFSRQSDAVITAPSRLTRGKGAPSVRGSYTNRRALDLLLEGSGLHARQTSSGSWLITSNIGARGADRIEGEVEIARTDDAGEASYTNEIVVTGSLIKGAASPSPTLAYTRQDIQTAGQGSVERFFEKLPQNFSSVGQDTYDTAADIRSQSNRSFGSSISLRGLGAGSTLILLDGQRLAPSGSFGAFVDISMIPLSAIDRVEVLTDGASALYGSDAVGGVVNFIMRDRFNGTELQLRSGIDEDGGLGELTIAPSAGTNWSSGSALVAYEHYQQEELPIADRAYARLTQPSGSDAFLFPRQNRDSGFAKAQQSIAPGLTVSGTALISSRGTFHRMLDPTYSTAGTNRSDSRQRAFQGNVTYDFSPNTDIQLSFADSISREKAEAVPARMLPYNTLSRSSASEANLLLRLPIIDLPGGQARAAIGTHYRTETYLNKFTQDDTFTNSGKRNVAAAFGELYLPLTDRLIGEHFLANTSLTVAARYDRYSDFGDSFVPKFGIRTDVTSWLSARGTYSKSFKAPLLSEITNGYDAFLLSVPDPKNVSGRGTGQAIVLIRSGDNDLTEEKSESWTAGFDVKSTDGSFIASLTGYRFVYRDRIARITNSLFEYLLQPEKFQPVIEYAPSSSLVENILKDAKTFGNFAGPDFTPLDPFDTRQVDALIRDGFVNVSSERQSGVDFNVSYTASVLDGTISANLSGTYILAFSRRITETSDRISLVDTAFYPPDFRMKSTLAWFNQGGGVSIAHNYVDEYTQQIGTTKTNVDSFSTIDVSLWKKVPLGRSSRVLNITFGISNIFDTRPPHVSDDGNHIGYVGYDTSNANPIGTFISVGGNITL